MPRDNDAVARAADVTAIAATDRVVLCEIDGEQNWVLQSQLHDDSEGWKRGDQGVLVVSEWWAEKAGLV